MNQTEKPLTCWVISDGRAGIQVQCTGLAEAMGLEPVIKNVEMAKPWKWLPPALIPLHPAVYGNDFPTSQDITTPDEWPDVTIACGRQAAIFNALVREKSRGKTFAIQVQDPRISSRHYDLVITPEHDTLRGDNVLLTTGGINRVTPARLEQAKADLAPEINALPRPRVAVLVGGKSKAYRLTETIVQKLGVQLHQLQQDSGCSFLVTTSRRTGKEHTAHLRQALADLPAFFWDGTGDNPYFGFLGSADAFIVTSDSVNMVTEAASTGKPVHVVELEGGNKKFSRFHQQLKDKGIIRDFTGTLEHWQYPPLSESKRIAKKVLERLARHKEVRNLVDQART
ncbi:mitochondrial fission ELM1 family protein [Kiloniella laminariae]|uniref:Mitochondrial fission ELM1 family protein n=2 Tax=Kiloniella laminariae TaxID=454162 RepID=A0ABT4LIJ6_9PROT|nr:mitochondrial fission ELM1 family protein [Kiloniella laminariae]MCZ4280919.1 mitochondrial fission ELM1 family protein [Kiloniella laminariae]